MNLMYFILCYIKKENIADEVKIIMEYQINTYEKERPDYLLIYRNEIIILEFGNAFVRITVILSIFQNQFRTFPTFQLAKIKMPLKVVMGRHSYECHPNY